MKIFIDMDGVLAKWDPKGGFGIPPAWKIPENRYFLHLEVDKRVRSILNRLWAKYGSDNVFVITQICNIGSVAVQSVKDKKEWLKNTIPNFPEKNFLPVFSLQNDGKIKKVTRKFWNRDESIILIDDRNENLIEWEKIPGAIGVKYINDFNKVESYTGPVIDPKMEIDDAVAFIDLLIQR